MSLRKPRILRRIVPSISPLAALAMSSALGSVCAIWVASGVGLLPEPPRIELEEIPARFAELQLTAPGYLSSKERSLAPEGLLGQGARAQREEGLAGVPGGDPQSAGCPLEQAAEGQTVLSKRTLDRQVAQSAGLLGARFEAGGTGGEALDASLTGGIGGILGAKGGSYGVGGLSSRGSGLGGGGSAAGLGTLGPAGAPGSGAGALALAPPLREPLPRAIHREEYTDYGLNPMTLTERDAQSTFSIDVDTASYAIARRKLRSGVLPPPAAVRVEEFVNYLPYDYAAPRDGRPFAVQMEAAPHPWSPGHHLLRVGVKGREIDQTHRPPVRLTFLVDVSGSMSSQDKLGLAQEALHFLVGQLGVEDSVAIATYAGRVEKVLEPTPTTRRSRIHAAIDSLSSGGSTAMNSGIDLAYTMAAQAFLEGAENRVIVLSDGDANVGPASHSAILETIAGYAGEGISLSTIGFGMGNYKDTLMEQLADKGDGNYHYVDSMREAEKIFGQDLAGTIQTIARDVKIQVAFDPEQVLAYRLVGYENRDIADCDFRNDAVDAGEVGSGHRVTALYDVVLADEISGPLAELHLRAKPPGPDAPAVEWTTRFPAHRLRASFGQASADFRIATAAAGFAEKLRASPHMDEVSYRQIAAVAEGALRPHHDEDGELLELIGEASSLAGEGALARR
jgi:Ca-activated chloride channel family protein